MSTRVLKSNIRSALNFSDLTRRAFREVAQIAGLVFKGYPGAPKRMYQLQANASLFFDLFSRFDSENLFIKQAEREILENELEISRL